MTLQHPKTGLKPTLLTLPLEIRLQIYNLLSHQIRYDTSPSPASTSATPFIKAARFCHLYTLQPRQWQEYRSPYAPVSIICTLRAVSWQLYLELRDFVKFRDLAMQIIADYKGIGEDSMVERIALAYQKEVLREHVAALLLSYRCVETGRSCRHCTKAGSGYRPYPSWITDTSSYYDRLISRYLPPRSIDRDSLYRAAAALEQFPALRLVHISFNHGDMVEWFGDELHDMVSAFEPFLRRGGVVTVGVEGEYDRGGRLYWPCNKAAEELQKGVGSVYMEGRFRNSRTLALRS